MKNANPLAAELLETSAAGYASAANVLLQETLQGTSDSGARSSEWKAHLVQRILELATAVRVNQPSLFARRISWQRRALQARGADESAFRAALESLRAALNQELPDALKATVKEPIRLALAALDAELEPESQALDTSTPYGKLGLAYLTACLEARAGSARKLILEALDGGMTPQDMYAKVLLPAQREIGQLWHMGDVSISEERLVSERTREVMTLIVNRFAPEPDMTRSVLAASVEGNAHDIGLRAVADLFKLSGWHVIFLGADMPAAEIANAAQSFDAKLVVLSATLTTHVGALGAAITRVRQVAKGAKILVGGLALEGSPDLWRQLEADAYVGDVDSAVAAGSRLIADG